MSQKHNYVCVYQVGGFANFQWKQCLPVRGYKAGCKQREEIQKMGYVCFLYREDLLEVPTEYVECDRR